MKCPKCGFNNDEDAKFCEQCGISLNAGSKIIREIKTNSNVKYLAILCIVLVVGIGITAGMVLNKNTNNESSIVGNNSTGNMSSQNITDNNVNNVSEVTKSNSNSEANKTSSDNIQTQLTPETSKLISASRAKSIAQGYINQPGARAATPTLSTVDGGKVYVVPVIYDSKQVGEIWINAQTGAIVGGSGGNP